MRGCGSYFSRRRRQILPHKPEITLDLGKKSEKEMKGRLKVRAGRAASGSTHLGPLFLVSTRFFSVPLAIEKS